MQPICAQLQHTRTVLAPVAGDAAALEARMLAARAWGMNAEGLVQHAHDVRDSAALEALVARRLMHEPVSHILGEKEFWKDTFEVTADVLTPRADSETMIEALLRQQAAPARILDLGTGSGCLLLSVLREYPNATGVAVDQSAAALAVAQRNAARLGLSERCAFVQSDWCANVQGQFDVILSNPPYIPRADIETLSADVRLFEPRAALDGGVDGLDCYRSILLQVLPHATAGALLLFEVGAGQADDVAMLGQAHGFTLIDISPDLAGISRVVVLQKQDATTY